jgi:hypothetical protein
MVYHIVLYLDIFSIYKNKMTKTHLNTLEMLKLVNLVFMDSYRQNHMESVKYVDLQQNFLWVRISNSN